MAKAPPNHRKEWMKGDDQQLRKLIREDTPTRAMGLKLGRTPSLSLSLFGQRRSKTSHHRVHRADDDSRRNRRRRAAQITRGCRIVQRLEKCRRFERVR